MKSGPLSISVYRNKWTHSVEEGQFIATSWTAYMSRDMTEYVARIGYLARWRYG